MADNYFYLAAMARKHCFKSTVFFPIMTPINIRRSPCPSQAPHGFACKISPPCVTWFQ